MKYLNNLSGWLCLDKPEGISSNFAIVKVRRIFSEKTGYVGTLDPFATGVLPIAVGEARKFIKYVEESEKTYIFTVEFGTSTDTLDKYGKSVCTTLHIPTLSEISDVIPSFLGIVEQTPPIFSAIKINGKRACDRARNGEEVNLKQRNITILDLKIISEELSKNKEVTFEVRCSKGTYVRVLAEDIAEKLGSLAYVKSLRRTKSGFFSIINAISLEKLMEIKDTNELASVLAPFESPLDDIPALYLRSDDVVRLQRGLVVSGGAWQTSFNVKIFGEGDRKFYGIGAVSADGSLKAVRMCIDKQQGEKDVDRK